MCDKCKALVECPVGEKRTVVVETPKKPEIVDHYGRVLHIGPVEMHIDKWPDGHADCFVGRDIHDDNDVAYGDGYDITHCPYCGERLV